MLGNDILASSDTSQVLTLEAIREEADGAIDGVYLLWSGDGKLEVTSPDGAAREPLRDGALLSPEAFADASSERTRIDLNGPRDAGSIQFHLRILTGSAFTIAAVMVRDGVPVGQSERATRAVTINGGVEWSFAPAVTAVQATRIEGGVEVELAGSLLSQATSIRVLGPGLSVLTPAWSHSTSGTIRFQLANDFAMQSRFVEVRDSSGRGSVEPCDLRANVYPPVKSQILARMREGFGPDDLFAVPGVGTSVLAVEWAESSTSEDNSRSREKYPTFALIDITSESTTSEVLSRVRQRASVESADSLLNGELSATPTDPRWPYQWTLRTSALHYCVGNRPFPNNMIPPLVSGGSINVNLAWDFAANGPPVGIGILDSGINGNHEDFNGLLSGLPHMRSALSPGFNPQFDPDPLTDAAQFIAAGGHGTPVAGIAAGRTGFDEPYSEGLSTASTSRYGLPVSLKCAFTNASTVASLAEALTAVVQHSDLIRVANMSIGFSTLSPTERVLLAATLRNAFLSGSLLVAAIGNDGGPVVKYPAAMSDLVFAVGAVDWNNSRWQNSTTLAPHCSTVPFPTFGSSYGSWLDVVAPGGVAVQAPSGDASSQTTLPIQLGCTFCSNYPHAPTSGFGGTSAAAPVVSGAAAWLMHVMPDLTSEDAGEVLRRSATDLSPPGFDIFHGHGSIDLWEATKFLHRPGTPLLKWLHHGALESQSGLSLIDSSAVVVTLTNSPLAVQNNNGQSQPAIRYRLRGTAAYPAYTSPPAVWVRRAGSLGVDDGAAWDHYERTPWAQVVDPVGLSACDFETYVYRLTNLNPATTDVFYPSAPAAARVAFTVLGADTPLHVDSGPPSSGRLRVEIRSAVPGSRLEFAVHGGLSGRLKASIFDLQGRRIAEPVGSESRLGSPVLRWDGSHFNGRSARPGMYLLRVERAGQVATSRFLLAR